VRRRSSQAGMTLMEIMIAIAIMVIMMTIAWQTIARTTESRRTFEAYETRNHELRMAMGRVVKDFEAAYLTMFVGKTGSKVPDIHFSTLGHAVLWADANESEQTVVSYVSRQSKDNPSAIDWIRREQRRPSNQPPEEEPADYDILVHDVVGVKIEYWNWKNVEWQDSWDTTQADGQKGYLPTRVRITVSVVGPNDKQEKLMTEARILMQEPLTGGRW
jgi:prepilin-type N-terminal cleavage/methylation domain-containing protein